MRLIDIHAHTNFKAFAEDAEAVIRSSLDAGIGLINVGTQLPTSQQAVALAERFATESVWAIVGQHPIHVGRHTFDQDGFLQLAKHPRVVAIGEVGLDYYHLGEVYDDPKEDLPAGRQDDGPPRVTTLSPQEHKKHQDQIFRQQIAVARAVGKPVMVHCRDAYADLARVIKEERLERFDVHCFTGGWDEAKPLLDLGAYISFTGIITFPKSAKTQEVVQKMPLDRLMVETDCPYLAPVPHRGERNLPQYVEFVARKVAELRGETYQVVASATIKNANDLFSLNSLQK